MAIKKTDTDFLRSIIRSIELIEKLIANGMKMPFLHVDLEQMTALLNSEKIEEAMVEPRYFSMRLEGSYLGYLLRHSGWLYQNQVYDISGNFTSDEKKLLLLDFADKERQKFERLKVKFSAEQTENIKYERTRIPETVRIEVWRRDQGKCAGCGSREKLEYDHIVPVSRGGSNTARNVELLCEPCNRAKGNQIQ